MKILNAIILTASVSFAHADPNSEYAEMDFGKWKVSGHETIISSEATLSNGAFGPSDGIDKFELECDSDSDFSIRMTNVTAGTDNHVSAIAILIGTKGFHYPVNNSDIWRGPTVFFEQRGYNYGTAAEMMMALIEQSTLKVEMRSQLIAVSTYTHGGFHLNTYDMMGFADAVEYAFSECTDFIELMGQ